MKFKTHHYFLAAVIVLLTGCGDNNNPVALHRLDLELAKGRVPADSAMAAAAETLFLVSGYGEVTDSAVAAYAAAPSIAIHRQAVDSVFSDTSGESVELGATLERLSGIIDLPLKPDIYTIISPFNQSVILADSTLFLGLNHYLGADYPPYGYFPDYIRRRKTRPRIPIDVAEAIVRSHCPFKTASPHATLLAKMIYEGAVTNAVMRATKKSDAETLGYTADESRWLNENESEMWNALLTRNLLYTTDPGVIRTMTAPSPSTSILTAEAPGEAGRWIGTRIVAEYLKNNPSVSLDQILADDNLDEREFLRNSGY